MFLETLKINRKLLPMKAHYFLQNAGLAPVLVFLPTIARQLGFTTVSFGWILTVSTVLTFFGKPLITSLVERFQIQKCGFLLLVVFTAVPYFAIQWVPPLVEAPVSRDCGPVAALVNRSEVCTDLGVQAVANTNFCQDGCLNLKPTSKEDWELLCNTGNRSDVITVDVLCTAIDSAMETLTDYEVLLRYQFWMMFTFFVVARLCNATCNSLADSIAFNLLGDQPERYGAQRMWVGIGWGWMALLSSIAVDAISQGKDTKDYTLSFYLMLVLLTVNVFVSSTLEIRSQVQSKNMFGDVTKVLKDPKICFFLLWSFFMGFYTSSIGNFLLWFIEDLDASQGSVNAPWIKTLQGLTAIIQTNLSEVPFFFFSGRILKKLGHSKARIMVLFCFALRFLLYSQLTNPWLVLPVEILHGLTYGMAYAVLATKATTSALPGTECTIQSLVSVTFDGAGASAGNLVTGYLVESIGYSNTFLTLAGSAVTLGLIHILVSCAPAIRSIKGTTK